MSPNLKRKVSTNIADSRASTSKEILDPTKLREHEGFAEIPNFYLWNERVEQAKAYHKMSEFFQGQIIDRSILDDPNYIDLKFFCDLNMVSTDHMLTTNFTYIKGNLYDLVEEEKDSRSKLILKCDCPGVCKPHTCCCIRAQKEAFPAVEHAMSNCYFWCSREVFRRNENVGFGMRTLNDINMNQVVSEFRGKIRQTTENSSWDERHEHYSLELTCEDIDYILGKLGEVTEYTNYDWKSFDSSKKPIVNYHILPYVVGNVSRFVAHGCTPNVIPIRVIVNKVHPMFHRIFFKALHPITRGSELFFDYGPGYITKHKFDCGCLTKFCNGKMNQMKKNFFPKLNFDELFSALMDRRTHHQKIINKSARVFAGTDQKTGLFPGEQVLGNDEPDPNIYAESEHIRRRNENYNDHYIGMLGDMTKSDYLEQVIKESETEENEQLRNIEYIPEGEEGPPPLYSLPDKRYKH